MELKNEIYISGGEVKVVTLLDKLTPEFWLTENLEPTVTASAPVGLEATLSRLVAEVRDALNDRIRHAEPARADSAEQVARRYLSRGQRRQAAMFTNAAVGWTGGLRRSGLAIRYFMYLMLATPVL